jgi:hypothetical protein
MIVNNKKKIPEQTGIDSDFNPEIKDILSQKYSSKEEAHKKYESECLRILKEYPEQLKSVFNWEYCDLEFEFLGFIDQYYSETVPADFTVIDFGCCQAVQACYFEGNKKYIGIDNAVPIENRFLTENAEYYDMSIQDFIKDILPTLHLDLEKAYAICSYVPDEEAQKLVADTFPYAKVVYCDKIIADRKPPILNFYNCLCLLGELAKKDIITFDPKDKNRILVYRSEGKSTPEGWYSENIHDAAQELLRNPTDQKFLLAAYEKAYGKPYAKQSIETKEEENEYEK